MKRGNIIRNRIEGHHLEKKVFGMISKLTDKNWINVWLSDDKIKREIDNLFFHNNNLYIVQCKHTFKSRYNSFWVSNNISNDLYLNGKKVTWKYLNNLWDTSKLIQNNPIYKTLGYPNIKTILLIDGNLKCGNKLIDNCLIRNTLIVTYLSFHNFLSSIGNHTGGSLYKFCGTLREQEPLFPVQQYNETFKKFLEKNTFKFEKTLPKMEKT